MRGSGERQSREAEVRGSGEWQWREAERGKAKARGRGERQRRGPVRAGHVPGNSRVSKPSPSTFELSLAVIWGVSETSVSSRVDVPRQCLRSYWPSGNWSAHAPRGTYAARTHNYRCPHVRRGCDDAGELRAAQTHMRDSGGATQPWAAPRRQRPSGSARAAAPERQREQGGSARAAE